MKATTITKEIILEFALHMATEVRSLVYQSPISKTRLEWVAEEYEDIVRTLQSSPLDLEELLQELETFVSAGEEEQNRRLHKHDGMSVDEILADRKSYLARKEYTIKEQVLEDLKRLIRQHFKVPLLDRPANESPKAKSRKKTRALAGS